MSTYELLEELLKNSSLMLDFINFALSFEDIEIFKSKYNYSCDIENFIENKQKETEEFINNWLEE